MAGTESRRQVFLDSTPQTRQSDDMNDLKYATFGGGCFWCTEAVFQQIDGVESVESGYCGGEIGNPSYEAVCTGKTGHAEVIQIVFDPARVSFEQLLDVFFQTHDPTTLNRQGNDVGTQYRSAIFFHDEEQQASAEQFKKNLNQIKAFASPVVTQIAPISTFFAAELYHQNYFRANPAQPYCAFHIGPKVGKFREQFQSKLKLVD